MNTTKIIKIILPSQIILMTIHNRHLQINGENYFSHISDNVIIMQQNDALNPDILQLKLFCHAIDFTNGIIQVNDYNLDIQSVITPEQFYGKIYKIDVNDGVTTIYAQSVKSKLKTHITRTYQSGCGADWGDSRCTLNKDFFKQTILITQKNNNLITYNPINGYFGEFYSPYITNNLGEPLQIYNLDTNQKTFLTENTSQFMINQTYSLYAGCHKTKDNCLKYQNFSNYLGFLK